MTSAAGAIRLGSAFCHEPDATVADDFTTIDGDRYAAIYNVDRMAPFLMSIASDSDAWLFVGSNGPFVAGRGSPDTALFPYQTVDKILRYPTTSGAQTILLVSRGDETFLWEPWLDGPRVYTIDRNLYKRTDGTAVLFEETNHDLGLRFRWSISACDRFGLVRRVEIDEIGGHAGEVRYLDGWHQLIPPGVDQETYARYSYLATAYMHHERLPGVPLAVYALNAAITDRPEPSESLRVAAAWSVGHTNPQLLLSDRQVASFRGGATVEPEMEVRGDMGAYLVADQRHLDAGGRHSWLTVADTGLDHAAVHDLLGLLATPAVAEVALKAAVATNSEAVRGRVAVADGLQQTADESATASHFSNVLFNIMRGGTFENGYAISPGDLASYLGEQNRVVLERHRAWVESLPAGLTLQELRSDAATLADPQLDRLVRSYLPLTFSRRHGDPSRPWNRFSIRVRDAAGNPVYGYQGNWRDIFQNWEALGQSFPGYLGQFVNVFLNASTADGYNPYRIARSGFEWEIEDPTDPWSHIGYWGDHQIVYLLRLLESLERHEPGALGAALDDRIYACANVPYRIADFASILSNPRATISVDKALHDSLLAASRELGADGRLIRDAGGEVRLVNLCEKLLVPVLVKLTNLVPGGGIWLNTQRPEWNDANNALAGWGLSIVTLSAIPGYLTLLASFAASDRDIPLSAPVARLLESVTAVLAGAGGPYDDARRFGVMVELGRAGEAHRRAVYARDFGADVATPTAAIRALAAAALPVIEQTLRASLRSDGLYHSYNLLRIDGDRAAVDNLGPMLEGQVAVLESGILGDAEAVALLRALRASDLYRADQRSYMLYPDRVLTPFLERNTLRGMPPLADAKLFVADHAGKWHFQADLSTMADVDRGLREANATAGEAAAVRRLWRETFSHDRFTGRSGTFFAFEGLGSIYWHMVAKLLLAVQRCHRHASDPAAGEALAGIYDEIRDGFNFRKTAGTYGAFPTDPYSHTPRHRGAQQPGMTGQVKEQILTRLGELGVEVSAGRLGFDPRLLHLAEFSLEPSVFRWLDASGTERAADLPAGSLAFTCCQVPVFYRLGDTVSMELERADGTVERVDGARLDQEASRTIFERQGTYRRLSVSLPRDQLRGDEPSGQPGAGRAPAATDPARERMPAIPHPAGSIVEAAAPRGNRLERATRRSAAR